MICLTEPLVEMKPAFKTMLKARYVYVGRSVLACLATVTCGLGVIACGGSSGMTAKTTKASAARDPGNDNNIPAYGHEASPQDTQAVILLVERYYVAAAAHDGAKACAMLYPTLEVSVPEDYGEAPAPAYQRGKTCPVVMTKLFRHLARHNPDQLTMPAVTGVRLYKEQGFAELRTKTMPKGELFVKRWGQSWRLGVLIGRERTGP